jgi:hypothetical protein
MRIEAPTAGADANAPARPVPPVPIADATAAAKAAKTSSASAKPQAVARASAPKAPPPPPAESHDHADDGLDGLYELAAQEKQARTSGAIDESPRCPKCFSDLTSGAVLCTNCGFDLRSGKKLSTQRGDAAPPPLKPLAGGMFGSKAPKPGKAAKAPRADAGEGNYFLGLAMGIGFSVGGAAIYGSATYFLDAIPFVGWLTGWLVLAVGYLAGLGVDKGYKGGNLVAGLTAAGITLVTVLVTKFVVIAALIVPSVKHAMDNAASDRDDPAVHSMVLDEVFKEHSISKHGASMEQITAYSQEASDRVKKMSDSQYKQYEQKSEMYETREELSDYVRDDILKEKKLDPMTAPKAARLQAADEADTRVAAMSDAEATQKLKVYDAAAEQKLQEEFAAASKNHSGTSASSSSSDDDSGSSGHSGISGSIIGFGIILGLIFLVWLFLPTIIAMLLAYRVAANA